MCPKAGYSYVYEWVQDSKKEDCRSDGCRSAAKLIDFCYVIFLIIIEINVNCYIGHICIDCNFIYFN